MCKVAGKMLLWLWISASYSILKFSKKTYILLYILQTINVSSLKTVYLKTFCKSSMLEQNVKVLSNKKVYSVKWI